MSNVLDIMKDATRKGDVPQIAIPCGGHAKRLRFESDLCRKEKTDWKLPAKHAVKRDV